MQSLFRPVIASCAVLLASCEKSPVESVEEPVESEAVEELKHADMPILPVEKGDFWKYDVHVEVPAGITSEGSSAMDLNQEKTRTYLGKVKPSPELPETDAFDVVSPGQATQREFVEITPESVMMRGSARPDILDAKPIWLDPAVPFVIAGMRPGQEMAPLNIQDGARTRGMKVVAREKVKVPAGEFAALRLLDDRERREFRNSSHHLVHSRHRYRQGGEDKICGRETSFSGNHRAYRNECEELIRKSRITLTHSLQIKRAHLRQVRSFKDLKGIRSSGGGEAPVALFPMHQEVQRKAQGLVRTRSDRDRPRCSQVRKRRR